MSSLEPILYFHSGNYFLGDSIAYDTRDKSVSAPISFKEWEGRLERTEQDICSGLRAAYFEDQWNEISLHALEIVTLLDPEIHDSAMGFVPRGRESTNSG